MPAAKKPAAKTAAKPAAKPPAKTGRPSKLTPEVQDRIVQAVSAGNYQDVAARYAGIDPATFYRWMAAGAEPDAPDALREFREAVESARAQSEVRAIALIQKAASDGTWQAAAWFLERSHPHRWGRLQRTEVTGAGGGPVEVDVAGLERKIAEALGEDKSSEKA